MATGLHLKADEINRHLVSIDVWSGRVINLNVQPDYDEGNCPCCKQRNFAYLSGQHESRTTKLCGRDAVQINKVADRKLDFAAIEARLKPVAQGTVTFNQFMLKASVGGYELTLFPDGRAIIKGTDDGDRARSLYARYVGT